MKLMSILSAMTLFVAFNASADSQYLDSARMSRCGGSVELRKADNGDLAIKFEGLNTDRCWKLRFYDYTSGRTIKTYDIKGTSYTLSQDQRQHLSSDCKVGFSVSGQTQDDFTITLGWWSCATGGGQTGGGSSAYSYQWSNSGNCKVLVNGVYANRNASDSFCQGAQGKEVVSYEYSAKRNCKLMINGQYANKNVDNYFCDARP